MLADVGGTGKPQGYCLDYLRDPVLIRGKGRQHHASTRLLCAGAKAQLSMRGMHFDLRTSKTRAPAYVVNAFECVRPPDLLLSFVRF